MLTIYDIALDDKDYIWLDRLIKLSKQHTKIDAVAALELLKGGESLLASLKNSNYPPFIITYKDIQNYSIDTLKLFNWETS